MLFRSCRPFTHSLLPSTNTHPLVHSSSRRSHSRSRVHSRHLHIHSSSTYSLHHLIPFTATFNSSFVTIRICTPSHQFFSLFSPLLSLCLLPHLCCPLLSVRNCSRLLKLLPLPACLLVQAHSDTHDLVMTTYLLRSESLLLLVRPLAYLVLVLPK